MLVGTSCKEDFLDLSPLQSIADDRFFQSLGDYQAAIVGGYNQMQNSDWYGRYILLVPDVMGEDVKQNASANRAKEWAEYSGSPQDFIPEEIWAEVYEGIGIANRIINSIYEAPSASVESQVNQIKGEAYAMRALAYFDLVKIFGQHYTFTSGGSHLGVPIVLDFDVSSKPARSTVAEVYSQIISDFQQGISLMNAGNGSGRFSKEAAQALLSRVYLYMEDYANAEQMATQVINSGKYSLISAANYPTQFADGNTSEAILEIVFNQVDNPGSDHLGGMYRETGYGDYLPATDLLDMMADGDVRKTMFAQDANLGGIYGNLRVNKFPTSGSIINTENIPVIRLAEVYLNRAEARAKSGNAAGAQEDLNTIRQRANSAAAAVTATGEALIAEILKERRIELAFEGHGVLDATRNKQGIVRDDCTSTVCNIAYPNDRFVLPIPIEEMDVNPNMVQNPGYGQ